MLQHDETPKVCQNLNVTFNECKIVLQRFFFLRVTVLIDFFRNLHA